jgi:site-specific recombinase XerD
LYETNGEVFHEITGQYGAGRHFQVPVSSGKQRRVMVYVQPIRVRDEVFLQPGSQEKLAHRAHSFSKKRVVLPTVLNKQEILSLIESASNPKNKAIISTLYATGVRLHELANILLTDIDSERNVIFIREGKGGKDRAVPLSPALLRSLREYWKSCIHKPATFLFPGTDLSKPLGLRWVQGIVTNSARKAGIQKKVSPHTLRHSFATHLLEDGVNVRVIQFLLGHKSLKTTATYMHIAKNYVNQAKSPLDSLYDQKESDNG